MSTTVLTRPLKTTSKTKELPAPKTQVTEDELESEVGRYYLAERLKEECPPNREWSVPEPLAVKRRAYHKETHQPLVCKEIPRDRYPQTMVGSMRLGFHENIEQPIEVICGERKVYVMYPMEYEDLHEYVKKKKRLGETEARNLFRQVVEAVSWCHECNILVRDMKLRKLVFRDTDRVNIILNSMEESHVLPDTAVSDVITRKQGSPAYVSPEVLSSRGEGYPGRPADMWALGVVLYTLLHGRYPFQDTEITRLFAKIRRGSYVLSASLSLPCRQLIKSLLTMTPTDRPDIDTVRKHPWFTVHNLDPPRSRGSAAVEKGRKANDDQVVPQ